MSDEVRGLVEQSGYIRRGGVVVDQGAHLVTVEGRYVQLALQEFRLLTLLMENADHVMSRRDLLEQIWGPDFHGDPKTLTVHILRLRHKLEKHPEDGVHLRTVRNIGYIFDTVPIIEEFSHR